MKRCSVKAGCGKLKEFEEFTWMPSKNAYNYLCKVCCFERHKVYYEANREKINATTRKRRHNYPDVVKAAISLSNKKKHQELKKQVFDHFGRVCKCCGENNEAFLCIDHVYNNGADHRKEIKNISFGIYNWLVKNDFPDGFQVLCHNCNFSKSVNDGSCAHKFLERSTTIPEGEVPPSGGKCETSQADEDIVCSA